MKFCFSVVAFFGGGGGGGGIEREGEKEVGGRDTQLSLSLGDSTDFKDDARKLKKRENFIAYHRNFLKIGQETINVGRIPSPSRPQSAYVGRERKRARVLRWRREGEERGTTWYTPALTVRRIPASHKDRRPCFSHIFSDFF